MATPTQKRLNRTVEEINPLLDKLDEDYTKEQIDEKFSAIAGGIHYKGEVNYYSDLPNDAEVGDAYTVKYAGSSGTTPDGSEYVWGAVSGVNQWIDFSKDTYTKAEVTALLALKQDTIDSSHKLSSDLVDDTNNTHKFATAAQLQQISTNENNISLINHAANTSLYFSEIEPTGTIVQGSYWISTSSTKIYNRTNQLFDYTTMAPDTAEYRGKSLNANGTIVSAAAWSVTDFIPCDGTEFTINPIGGNTTSICLYNAAKEYITGKAYSTGGAQTKTAVTVTTSETAKYIRFTYNSGGDASQVDDLSSIMLNQGSTAATYAPYLDWQ